MLNENLRFALRIFSRILMLLLVLPVTNSVKGWVAAKLGDDTAEREGRITLNPAAHLDLFGSLMIMLCGFGWSKPMPINASRMKDFRKGLIIISLTGPVTHFVSAIICKNLAVLIPVIMFKTSTLTENTSVGVTCVILLLSFLSNINICLGVIDLLPIPPLDGFNILQQVAGQKFNKWYFHNYQMVNRASLPILLILFYAGTLTGGHFDPLGWLIYGVDSLLELTTLWIPKVFGLA